MGQKFHESFNELVPDLKSAILRDYDICTSPHISLIKFSENIICLLENDGNSDSEKKVIRVCRPGYHDKEELENELIWITEIEKYKKEIIRTLNFSSIQTLTENWKENLREDRLCQWCELCAKNYAQEDKSKYDTALSVLYKVFNFYFITTKWKKQYQNLSNNAVRREPNTRKDQCGLIYCHSF